MLDAAWQLDPGRGSLTMAALLDPRAVAVGASYRHRLSPSWAAGADASLGYDWRVGSTDWRATLAFEARW